MEMFTSRFDEPIIGGVYPYARGVGGFAVPNFERKLTIIALKQDLILAHIKADTESIQKIDDCITELLKEEAKEIQDKIDWLKSRSDIDKNNCILRDEILKSCCTPSHEKHGL